MEDVSAALSRVKVCVSKHQESANRASHTAMLDSIERLHIAAEGPANYAAKLRFQFTQAPFLLIGVQTGMLDAIANKRGAPISARDIAAETKQDPLLVVRTMRILTALKVAEERDDRVYSSNAITEALLQPEQKAGLSWSAELLWPISGSFGAYMARSGVKQFPADASEQGPFEYTFGAPMYKYFETHLEAKRRFDEYFAIRKYGETERWFDIFPIAEHLASSKHDDAEDRETLIADVGGGRGHDLIALAEASPTVTRHGRMIAQDLPATVKDMQTTKHGIEYMAYDFFTPQPVIGAKYYFMHHICHNWSDDKARVILKNTAKVMRPDSRLLLHELVLPDQGAPMRAALFDATMLLLVNGMQRTERQWQELLGSAQLQIEKVWTPSRSGEAIIECRLSG